MAKLKFKDESNNFIPVVQNVKVNGASVFDGVEANIIIDEYTISVPRMANNITISTADLTYIRNKKPRTLKINFNNGNTVNLILDSANPAAIKYGIISESGNYTQFAYYLRITSSDTEQTGCAFSWEEYMVAPQMPIFPEGRTFVLKLIDGVPNWVEET